MTEQIQQNAKGIQVETSGCEATNIDQSRASTTSMDDAVRMAATRDEGNNIPAAEFSVDPESKEMSAAGDDFHPDDKIVWWDGPEDPENPYNWSNRQKILNCGLVSIMTLVSALGSCKYFFFFLLRTSMARI